MRFTVAFLLAAVASVAFLLVGTVDQSVLISYLLGEQEENDEATDSFSPVAGQPLALSGGIVGNNAGGSYLAKGGTFLEVFDGNTGT